MKYGSKGLPTGSDRKCDMLNGNMRRLAGLGAVALLVFIGAAFVACGGSDDADQAEHVEADEAEDVEGDEHEDGDAGAFAYLEAAPKDQLYLVEMTSFAYAPEALGVTAGDVLEIAVQNVEAVLHDFTIDEIDADVHVSYLAGTGQHAHTESQLEADVHFALTEPGTGVVHMKIHEPGEYVFYCSVPGHRDAGMEGTLIVRPGDDDGQRVGR